MNLSLMTLVPFRLFSDQGTRATNERLYNNVGVVHRRIKLEPHYPLRSLKASSISLLAASAGTLKGRRGGPP